MFEVSRRMSALSWSRAPKQDMSHERRARPIGSGWRHDTTSVLPHWVGQIYRARRLLRQFLLCPQETGVAKADPFGLLFVTRVTDACLPRRRRGVV